MVECSVQASLVHSYYYWTAERTPINTRPAKLLILSLPPPVRMLDMGPMFLAAHEVRIVPNAVTGAGADEVAVGVDWH